MTKQKEIETEPLIPAATEDLIEIKIPNNLQLNVPLQAYQKLIAYAQACQGEVSGFADVVFDPLKNAFRMTDVYLLEQEATAAHVELDEESVAKFNLELAKKGRDQLPQVWWHSHADMETFFSGIDEGTLRELQNDTFIIAVVVNKKGHIKAKMYVYAEAMATFGGGLFEDSLGAQLEIDPLHVKVDMELGEIPKDIVKEVAKKVREPKPSMSWNPFRKFDEDEEEEETKGKKKKPLGEGKYSWDDKEFHDAFSDDPDVKVYRLSKDEEDAKRKVKKLGLVKEWSKKGNEMVWIDPKSHSIWVDYWDVLRAYWGEE